MILMDEDAKKNYRDCAELGSWDEIMAEVGRGGIIIMLDTIDARDAEIAALKDAPCNVCGEGCQVCGQQIEPGHGVTHESCRGWCRESDAGLIADLQKEHERLNSSIESWKREEVLRDEREAGKDAEIAELKATLNLSARANNALALKIGRLVEAGDGLADLVCEQRPRLERYEDVVEAWTAAKGGPSFWVRLSGPPDDQFKTATYTIEFDDNGSTYRATGVAYKLAAEQGAKGGE